MAGYRERMTDWNPYRSCISHPRIVSCRRWHSFECALIGLLLGTLGVLLDATSFVPPRPMSVNIAEAALLIGGIGLLIDALRTRRK